MVPQESHEGVTAARDITEFLAAPFGKYVLRRTFLFWQLSREVNGVIAWGRPDVEDVEEMTKAFDVVFHPDFGWHLSLVDTRGIEAIDGAAFEKLLAYLESRQEAYARCVTKQALIVTRGVFGSALAGFYNLISTRYPTGVFTDASEAIAWLAPSDPERVRATFESLRDRVLGAPAIVGQVRALLEAEQKPLSVEEAARKLALSPRTLQRRLEEAQTSMRDEVRLHRLRVGEQLLATSDRRISEVARELGVTEAQLAKLFRREHGVSPRAFRLRVRGATH